MGGGILYGATSVIVGYPFDTIKTKMQAQSGFENSNMLRSFLKTLREQGVRGLYRGCIPPIAGFGVFLSAQFATFEATYTYWNTARGRYELPLTGGVQLRVLAGGIAAATARALLETPLEYAKVRRQTQQNWRFREIYRGFGVTWCRTVGLLCAYFVILDSMRRHHADLYQSTLFGPFFVAGLAATSGWWVVWPLEYMKSQVQCSYGKDQSVWLKMRAVVREKGGFIALYRGIFPGTIRSFLANGASMIVMANSHKIVTKFGLR